MLTDVREFVLLGDPPGANGDVPRIDDPRFSMAAAGKSSTVRRTWIDTFDWRLFRAGLTLELLVGRGTSELVVTGRDGELVATELTAPPTTGRAAANGRSSARGDGSGQLAERRVRWPSLVQDLPVGALRERLAPVVGVRALLPVTKATSVRFESGRLNSDDKTVAVLAVDQKRIGLRHGKPPAGTRSSRSGGDRQQGDQARPTCSAIAGRSPSGSVAVRGGARPQAGGQVTTPARSTSS